MSNYRVEMMYYYADLQNQKILFLIFQYFRTRLRETARMRSPTRGREGRDRNGQDREKASGHRREGRRKDLQKNSPLR